MGYFSVTKNTTISPRHRGPLVVSIDRQRLVADIEDADPADIEPIYDCIGGLIAALFSSPPPAAADAELEFTYRGYRIHVSQDGTTTVRHAT
ncbi:HalOD1 output domain-containing protein [Halosolutus halophilus]|uniref:HalOD1 output domain-containing protein n=1 Tax=Halosolutus halophilus TaxID=1552990 RepID=UPI00223511F7|nr:HalOD1 output domain-containing protein [Halosolutus halophilus]